MPATVQVGMHFGAGPSTANLTADGLKFNREDTHNGTTPIPIPTATGTNYSWLKYTFLNVTVSASTSISNRRIKVQSATPTGMQVCFKTDTTYTQASSGNMPAAAGTNGAVPAGFTAVTTSNQVYHNNAVSAGSTGKNGDYCTVVLGVDNLYTSGADSNASVATLVYTYDEA